MLRLCCRIAAVALLGALMVMPGTAARVGDDAEAVGSDRQSERAKDQKIIAAARKAFPLRVMTIRKEPSPRGVKYIFELDARHLPHAPSPVLTVHIDTVRNASEADILDTLEKLASDVRTVIGSKSSKLPPERLLVRPGLPQKVAP